MCSNALASRAMRSNEGCQVGFDTTLSVDLRPIHLMEHLPAQGTPNRPCPSPKASKPRSASHPGPSSGPTHPCPSDSLFGDVAAGCFHRQRGSVAQPAHDRLDDCNTPLPPRAQDKECLWFDRRNHVNHLLGDLLSLY